MKQSKGEFMKIIGITGGVGCGKSEVIRYIINKYHCEAVFADDVAKQIQKKGNKCYDDIVNLLGKEILDNDGEINKEKMAEIIFADEKLLKAVNAVVHPAVKTEILKKIKEAGDKNQVDFFILEAALLIECGYKSVVDEMWFVYTKDDIRRERLKQSRHYSDEKISRMFKSQLSFEEFYKAATFVLDNNGSMELTEKQIDDKLEEYLCQK